MLFEPRFNKTTIYALVSAVAIFAHAFAFVVLWAAHIEGRKNRSLNALWRKVIDFLGFGITLRDMVIGICFGVGLSYATLILEKPLAPIYFRPIPAELVGIAIYEITFVPLLEETIYRGIYLNLFERFYGNNKLLAICGVVTASTIFGWIHPIRPIIKTIGGLALGMIYLWRRNLFTNALTHACVNYVLIFFDVA